MDKVELRPAWQWVCPECGELNFEEAITAEQTPEEMERLRQAVESGGNEFVDSGLWMTQPDEVECVSCDKEFEVEGPTEEEEPG